MFFLSSKFVVLLLCCFLIPSAKSNVIIRITDHEGRLTHARVSLMQDGKQLFRTKVEGTMAKKLAKGTYQLTVIRCDTTIVPIKVWNDDHEFNIAVDTQCEK